MTLKNCDALPPEFVAVIVMVAAPGPIALMTMDRLSAAIVGTATSRLFDLTEKVSFSPLNALLRSTFLDVSAASEEISAISSDTVGAAIPGAVSHAAKAIAIKIIPRHARPSVWRNILVHM